MESGFIFLVIIKYFSGSSRNLLISFLLCDMLLLNQILKESYFSSDNSFKFQMTLTLSAFTVCQALAGLVLSILQILTHLIITTPRDMYCWPFLQINRIILRLMENRSRG